jgi:hypothetical protein
MSQPQPLTVPAYYLDHEPRLDRLAREAGPDRALVADAGGVRGRIEWDAEAGAPVEDVPSVGWLP